MPEPEPEKSTPAIEPKTSRLELVDWDEELELASFVFSKLEEVNWLGIDKEYKTEPIAKDITNKEINNLEFQRADISSLRSISSLLSNCVV